MKSWESNSWTILYCDSVDEIRDALSNQEFMWPLILRGIEWLIEEERSSTMILEGRLSDGNDVIWVSISNDEVPTTIQKMIDWRLSREEYEECAIATACLERWQTREMAQHRRNSTLI